MSIHHAKGPATATVTREQAISELQANPNFPKSSDFDVWEESGRWVVSWHQPNWHEAEFPGAPADSEEESSGPKSEGPDDSAPAPPDKGDGDGDSDDGPPSADGGEGGPPKEHGEHGEKGGEKHELIQILQLLQSVTQALGIEAPVGGEESPVPGQEMAPPPPGPPGPPHPHGGPPGAGGPPPGGPDQTVEHQRALKPGEAPPGSTPVGAPAFASTLPSNHPWKDVIGKVATFTVDSDPISDNDPLAPIHSELERVAVGTGYRIAQMTEARDDSGHRIARALISAH